MENHPLNLSYFARLRKAWALVPVLGLLGALLSAPRTARANSGETSFLEATGIGIAVGTVLGASTLPFYDQPGAHTINLAYGAAAGVSVAIVYGIYQLFAGPSQDRAEGAEFQRRGLHLFARGTRSVPERVHDVSLKLDTGRSDLLASVRPAHYWMPVVSVTW
jgi:hypothetical protein